MALQHAFLRATLILQPSLPNVTTPPLPRSPPPQRPHTPPQTHTSVGRGEGGRGRGGTPHPVVNIGLLTTHIKLIFNIRYQSALPGMGSLPSPASHPLDSPFTHHTHRGCIRYDIMPPQCPYRALCVCVLPSCTRVHTPAHTRPPALPREPAYLHNYGHSFLLFTFHRKLLHSEKYSDRYYLTFTCTTCIFFISLSLFSFFLISV